VAHCSADVAAALAVLHGCHAGTTCGDVPVSARAFRLSVVGETVRFSSMGKRPKTPAAPPAGMRREERVQGSPEASSDQRRRWGPGSAPTQRRVAEGRAGIPSWQGRGRRLHSVAVRRLAEWLVKRCRVRWIIEVRMEQGAATRLPA
jgi:hypothetical protein